MTISLVLERPSLTSWLRGVPPHDRRVVQFRGIKFGEFTERYAKFTLVESYPVETDSTSHGHASFCLFSRIPENERKRAAAGLTQNELECLSPVIPAPNSTLNPPDSEEVLPMISGGVPLLDIANFVKKSMDIGTPIPLEQRWVQKHIHGFRSDPKMVTIGGNSAGSFSTEAHLNVVPESDTKGLFNRAIMQSRTMLSRRLRRMGFFTRGWGEVGAGAPEWCDALLIGDAEFNIPRRNRRSPLSAYQIQTGTPPSPVPAVTKHDSTLQFLLDLLVSFPNHRIPTTWRRKNKQVYEYIRPAQPMGPQNWRAHHAAEMLSLLGIYTFSEETHEAMRKAAMQEHFISFIRGDVLFEAAEGEAMKYRPVGKVAVGWNKDSRNVSAWKVTEGLGRDVLVKTFDIVGGCIEHYYFSHDQPLK
ncbi:hypothetical protein B9Z19DRAFT_1154483 [Tuber borchii]|uniref:Carboxylesterase type B domain-containing protein n=1 Tax=Tuber borchii TaxID=42251 RepID=A0A2T6ZIB6_TUBBO|nr:hypothetical protein B9Z19DRAFT_1154483 [Tuber borchii]